ncbi:hypothetical protein ACOMHN_021093 [Nucella lapillus]
MSGAGEVGTSIGESKKAKQFLSRFERGRLPVYSPCGPFFLQPQHSQKETGPEVRGIDASLLLPAPFPKVPRGASGGCRPYMFRG